MERAQPTVQIDNDHVRVTEWRFAPGAETGWHRHPVPGAGYILSGKLTLLVDGGRVFELTPGQAFTETVDTLHNGRNLGSEPVVLLVTWLGQEGKPYTVKGTAP